MGGYGSGRQWGKDTTSNWRTLDVRLLQREGLLTPGWTSTWHWMRNGREIGSLRIHAERDWVHISDQGRCNDGAWQQSEQIVRLEWTPCNLGGQRAWFLCPGQNCCRRVAILYSGRKIGCRRCHKLGYACQRETSDNRALRRAETIRQRLGWSAGIANPQGDKPAGMHWRTFKRLLAAHNAYANASWLGLVKWLDRLGV